MDTYHIDNVSYVYSNSVEFANKNISLGIQQGEIFCLLGANGAGKSTLIKQMVGLLTPHEGDISLFGKSIIDRDNYVSQHVSYMPQRGEALNTLTVAEVIYFVAHLRGLSRPDAITERDMLIERLELGDVRDQVSQRISGGQKRLTMIAVTLAANYPVLILDEPTNDLDPKRRHQIWDLFLDFKKERGTTCLLVTHNVVEAERVIDRIGIMRDGQLISVGYVGELKQVLARQLQLEIRFRPDRHLALLDHLPHRMLSDRHCFSFIEYDDASQIVQQIIEDDAIEDFVLTTPTLEDLYIQTIKE